jgi:hypothetical protein
MLRGTRILIVFFSAFTIATLLIPAPMFPGSYLIALVGSGIQSYTTVLSALLNGVVYGVSLWLLFIGFSRKLEQ